MTPPPTGYCEMSPSEALKELYSASNVNNCIEYLEGLAKHPPDGYGDSSLKEYWDDSLAIIQAQRAAAAQDMRQRAAKLLLECIQDCSDADIIDMNVWQSVYNSIITLPLVAGPENDTG